MCRKNLQLVSLTGLKKTLLNWNTLYTKIIIATAATEMYKHIVTSVMTNFAKNIKLITIACISNYVFVHECKHCQTVGFV